MPTPTELAHAERAVLGADLQPWHHTNGRLPGTGNPTTQAQERALQTARELAERRSRDAYDREIEWELGQPERDRLRTEAKAKEAEQLAAWRATRYAKELAGLTEANSEIGKFEEKIEALNKRRFDIKGVMMEQPHDIDAILEHANKLPALREAVQLLESEIARCSMSINEWTTFGRGSVEPIRNDLEQRLHDWKWQQRDLLKTETKDQFFAKCGRIINDTELDRLLQDSPAFAQLEFRPQLPSDSCMDVEQWKAAIAAVEALTALQERQLETPPNDAVEVPDESNRTKAATRSKTSHTVSR